MINPFRPGDIKLHQHVVIEQDTAVFDSGQVHPVYATFALGRDAEWACRLFVLEMKEADEEGIGVFLYITHHAPALIGDMVIFEAKVKAIVKNQVVCTFEAKVSNRLIASGETGQKILKRSRLEKLFNSL
jgi:predicted thioesterase